MASVNCGDLYNDPSKFFGKRDCVFHDNEDPLSSDEEEASNKENDPENVILEAWGAKRGPNHWDYYNYPLCEFHSFLFIAKLVLGGSPGDPKWQERCACLQLIMDGPCCGMALSDLFLPITIRLRELGVIIPIGGNETPSDFDIYGKYEHIFSGVRNKTEWYKIWGAIPHRDIKHLAGELSKEWDPKVLQEVEELHSECEALASTSPAREY